MTLTEAFLAARGRGVLPTSLSTQDLRIAFRGDVLRQSVFSARTAHMPYLSIMQDAIGDLLNQQTAAGKSIGQAETRVRLKEALRALKYDPTTGHFGTHSDASHAPVKRGSMQDLSSDRRLNLIIDTQRMLWESAAQNTRAKEPAMLRMWPCWEFTSSRAKEPRKDWEMRWRRAGGELYDGRMIAPVGSPVWAALGDSNMWKDALGTETPPFAFGSYRRWKGVSRRECKALGIPLPDSPPVPAPTSKPGPKPKAKPPAVEGPAQPPETPESPVPPSAKHDLPPPPKFEPPPDANPFVVSRINVTLQMGGGGWGGLFNY